MADVFISYSKARASVAGELANALTDLGYEVWWDTSLLPTGSFGAVIDRELDAAKVVIVIWSSESARSKWVYSEASHADRQDKLLNCHTSEITSPAVQIPKPFGVIHSVGVGNVEAIVRALDALGVMRSTPAASVEKGAPRRTQARRAPDDQLFSEVEATGSIEAYEFYLNEFPNGTHAPTARLRLNALRESAQNEAEAQAAAAREAESPRRDDQQRLVREAEARQEAHSLKGVGQSTNIPLRPETLAAWADAAASDECKQITKILQRWPEGPTKQYAQTRLETLQWAGLQLLPSRKSLEEFILRFPLSDYAAEVKRQIKALDVAGSTHKRSGLRGLALLLVVTLLAALVYSATTPGSFVWRFVNAKSQGPKSTP